MQNSCVTFHFNFCRALVCLAFIFFSANFSLSAQGMNDDGTETMVQLDTVITFDPATLKETVKIVRTETKAYLNPQFMPVFRSCKTVQPDDRTKCTNEKLATYIDSNLIYPFELREKRIDATVMIKFIVTEDGMVSHVSPVTRGNEYLDAEAVKVIEFLNRVYEDSPFYPGKANGEPVNVKMTVPVKFTGNTK